MEGLSDADFIYELAMLMGPRCQAYIDRAFEVSNRFRELEALANALGDGVE